MQGGADLGGKCVTLVLFSSTMGGDIQPPPIVLFGACGWEGLHVFLEIHSHLSKIEYLLGLGPKTRWLSWARDTLCCKKKKITTYTRHLPYVLWCWRKVAPNSLI